MKNVNIGSKPLKEISFFSLISEKEKKIIENIKQIDDWLDTAQLICKKTDGKTKYDFNNLLQKFIVMILRYR